MARGIHPISSLRAAKRRMATSAEDPPQWSAGRAVPRPVSQPSPPCACACLAPSALWTPPSSFSLLVRVLVILANALRRGTFRASPVFDGLWGGSAPSMRRPLPPPPRHPRDPLRQRQQRAAHRLILDRRERLHQPQRLRLRDQRNRRGIGGSSPPRPARRAAASSPALERFADAHQPPGADAVHALLVFLHLLERDADRVPRARSATSSGRVDERGCCGRRSSVVITRPARRPGMRPPAPRAHDMVASQQTGIGCNGEAILMVLYTVSK